MPWNLTGNSCTTAADFVGTTDNSPLVIKANKLEAMRVEPNGNVGVGTNNPIHMLQIGGGFDGNLGLDGSDGSPNAGYIRFGDHTGWKFYITRQREYSAGPMNTGPTGALLTIQDNGDITVLGSLNVGGDIVMPASDFAEDFDIETSAAVEPGTVMVLDENGRLQPCGKAYDKKVAGVISGAGSYKPGSFSTGKRPHWAGCRSLWSARFIARRMRHAIP